MDLRDKNNPYKGTYNIIRKGNPNEVFKTQEVTRKDEFDTLLDEVVKYNNAHEDKRQLILIK